MPVPTVRVRTAPRVVPVVLGLGLLWSVALLAAPPPATAGSPAGTVQAAKAAPTATATPARDEVYIELNPSTVEAGGRVGLRASCPDNNTAATVRSDAFGQVTVRPAAGLLTASVRIPTTQEPRTFTVRLSCDGGKTATATLHVVERTRPSQGPATGFGGTAGGGANPLIWLGLAAIAGGVAVGVVGARRRRVLG